MLRPVNVYQEKSSDTYLGEAVFHRFSEIGWHAEERYTAAVIEWPDGKVEEVPLKCIQFTDKAKTEPEPVHAYTRSVHGNARPVRVYTQVGGSKAPKVYVGDAVCRQLGVVGSTAEELYMAALVEWPDGTMAELPIRLVQFADVAVLPESSAPVSCDPGFGVKIP